MLNRNNVNISYRNAPNMKKIIAAQNSKVISESESPSTGKTCNCPKTKTCPFEGKCLFENVIYQARVKSDNSEETYIGLTSNTFKSRLSNHKKSMKNTDTTPPLVYIYGT